MNFNTFHLLRIIWFLGGLYSITISHQYGIAALFFALAIFISNRKTLIEKIPGFENFWVRYPKLKVGVLVILVLFIIFKANSYSPTGLQYPVNITSERISFEQFKEKADWTLNIFERRYDTEINFRPNEFYQCLYNPYRFNKLKSQNQSDKLFYECMVKHDLVDFDLLRMRDEARNQQDSNYDRY